MARKSKQDLAKQKAAKQKKIAIGGGVLLALLLAIQLPKTMKMLNKHPMTVAAATTTTTTPTVTPADPSTLVAPTLAGAPTDTTQTETTSSDLVSAVPMTVDPGQLKTFEQFASRDPFATKAPADAATPGSSSGGGGKAAPSKPSTPGGTTTTVTSPATPTPPPAAGGSTGSAGTPSTAVLSLNGELMSVPVGSDFPTAGATFARSGSVFHLLSLTATSAKVAIAGGSYADGAAALTLKLRTPVTLQNTADGSKYTLILEPQGTVVPAAPAASTSAASAATTTPASAVPSGSSG